MIQRFSFSLYYQTKRAYPPVSPLKVLLHCTTSLAYPGIGKKKMMMVPMRYFHAAKLASKSERSKFYFALAARGSP